MILKISKEKLIGIMLIFALCVLVLGMTRKYNNLIKEHNKLAEEVNECRAKEQPLFYEPVSDFLADYITENGSPKSAGSG